MPKPPRPNTPRTSKRSWPSRVPAGSSAGAATGWPQEAQTSQASSTPAPQWGHVSVASGSFGGVTPSRSRSAGTPIVAGIVRAGALCAPSWPAGPRPRGNQDANRFVSPGVHVRETNGEAGMNPTAQLETTRLEAWLTDNYATAYRTACLITRQPADAEEAVQEAFLRAWRFRDALPAGDGHRAWLYRVLVNACYSKLRTEIPRRDRSAGPAPLDGLADE